ncbi:hypothetical protein OAO58_00890 [bacterium]|nr:hypothetical protein [bacterium]
MLFLTLPICLAAEPVVDILKIAGKSKSEVESVLGKPTKTSKSKYGEKCTYKTGETEIVFIKGKADWITVEGVDELPFNERTIKSIGLKEAKTVHKTEWEMRWEKIQGLLSVSLFKGEKKSDYFYIKVKTK